MRSAPGALVRRDRAEEGNVSLLTLGWVVLTLLALLVMAAATQLHLDRMRLASLADELALAAADELDDDAYYSASDDAVELDDAAMAAAVSTWLGTDPRPWVADVMVVSVGGSGDGTATVTLARRVLPLFDVDALAGFAGGITLTAEGRARAG